jgi:hypothetical protein
MLHILTCFANMSDRTRFPQVLLKHFHRIIRKVETRMVATGTGIEERVCLCLCKHHVYLYLITFSRISTQALGALRALQFYSVLQHTSQHSAGQCGLWVNIETDVALRRTSMTCRCLVLSCIGHSCHVRISCYIGTPCLVILCNSS